MVITIRYVERIELPTLQSFSFIIEDDLFLDVTMAWFQTAFMIELYFISSVRRSPNDEATT